MKTSKRIQVVMALALIAALILPWTALADDLLLDGDVVTVGNQETVNLGTVAPGAILYPQVSFQLVCSGKQHVDEGKKVTLSYSFSGSSLDGLALPAGSVAGTDSTIGDVPASWPEDAQGGGSTNCDPTPQTLGDNGSSVLTIKAPSTSGPHTFVVRYMFSLNYSDNAISGNHRDITFNLTVAAPSDTTPPVITVPADITAEATGPSGAMVTYSASALDLVDGAVAANCVPSSASTFWAPPWCPRVSQAGDAGSDVATGP